VGGPGAVGAVEPLSSLAAATIYTATVSGATDASGHPMAAPVAWSFTTSATYGPGPFTIWSPLATPRIADDNVGGPVELGVRFTPAVSGTITGVRFYRGPLNTGATGRPRTSESPPRLRA
jgi:hypothetical protein